MEEERRPADDGCSYTKAEFIEFYGGLDEWNAAAPTNGSATVEATQETPATEETTATEGEKPRHSPAYQAWLDEQMAKKRGNVCHAWANYECTRGDSCRFDHEGEGGCAEGGGDDWGGGGGGGGVCYQWQNGECTRGDSCRFSHEGEGGAGGGGGGGGAGVCYAYQRGECTRGDSCRFSHEGDGGGAAVVPDDGQERKISKDDGAAYTKEEFIEFYGGTDEWDVAEAAPAGGGGFDGGNFNADAGGGDYDEGGGYKAPKPRICFAWENGRCPRGEECRFAHEYDLPDDTPFGIVSHYDKVDAPCYKFQDGMCFRGDNCRYSHDPAVLNAPKEPCFKYSIGKCNRGDTCRFLHEGEPGVDPMAGQPCHQFAAGECSYGDSCRFSHEPVEEGADDGVERRVGEDGSMYTKEEFMEFYGGYTEWDAAAPVVEETSGETVAAEEPEANGVTSNGVASNGVEAETEERRVGEDGEAYTKQEFIDFYGGTDEWDAATPVKTGLPKVQPEGEAHLQNYDKKLANGELSVDQYAQEVSKLDAN